MIDPLWIAATVGVTMALAVGAAATLVGMDRDRALYPVFLIFIAALYGLFAAIDGRPPVALAETGGIALFTALAIVGFRRSLWLVAVALAGHGLFDMLHGRFVENSGVPSWWPVFCIAYDLTAALYLGWLLATARVPARGGRR